jgi:UDP-N-acetylmuramyl pentapeptide phosphotransferase/UDP-N-acetylglucosamine-1-phosphate transferase
MIGGTALLDWWPSVAGALFAGMLMPVAIGARGIGHDELHGVQKMHVDLTSRLGGAMVVIAFLVVVAIAQHLGHAALADAVPLALAALPVVLIGLWEDVTRRVRPRYRMLAAIASGALASQFADGIVPRLDLPLIDDLLRHAWIALPLTWFMVAGSCNAMNIIDGAHGLAGGTALIMFGGIALAAGWSGDARTLAEALAVMGALVGFLVWNYPRGKIFLGDAGAYFIGFMYAEISIRLITRNSGISAWYVTMLAGYPIVDTLFSMYRRGMIQGRKLMAPDALHLHSLVFRRIAMPIERRVKDRRQADRRQGGPRTDEPPHVDRRQGERRRRDTNLRNANARVAPRLWLHSALCFALAVVFHDNTPALLVCLPLYGLFYISRYRALVRFGRKRAR